MTYYGGMTQSIIGGNNMDMELNPRNLIYDNNSPA
jgi:hypothetical protein